MLTFLYKLKKVFFFQAWAFLSPHLISDLDVGSKLGLTFALFTSPPGGHGATSGDISGCCYYAGEGMLLAASGKGPGMQINTPQYIGQPPSTKNSLAQNINGKRLTAIQYFS